MAIKGELFSTDMVKAFLEGRKSRTSRPIKPQPCKESEKFECWFEKSARFGNEKSAAVCSRKPKYQPGDIMYVRETWCQLWDLDGNDHVIEGTEKYYYRADGENPTPYNSFYSNRADKWKEFPIWTPSIHMPREAARLFFRVTDVKVQNITDMTEQDAVEDGFIADPLPTGLSYPALSNFKDFWHAQYGTESPWMWVYSLNKISREDALKDGTGKA